MGSVPVVAECTGCLIGILCPVLIDVRCLEDLKFEHAPKKTFPFIAGLISSATELIICSLKNETVATRACSDLDPFPVGMPF